MRTGAILHGYQLERPIGSGSFSEVWAARALEGDTPRVALKILRAPVTDLARARLDREIAANRRVTRASDGICRLVAALPERAGLVLELLAGPSLAERLERDGPLDPTLALPLFAGLFPALDVVRQAGIVHRDVSPANIVLDGPGRGKLIDFGMATIKDDDGSALGPSVTTDDTALGSLVHAAPEQIDDPRTVGSQADMYGLGSTLFMALAGRPAFRAPTMAVLLALKAERNPPRLAEVTSRPWPTALEDLLSRLLARDPGSRPTSGRDVAIALGRLPELGRG